MSNGYTTHVKRSSSRRHMYRSESSTIKSKVFLGGKAKL